MKITVIRMALEGIEPVTVSAPEASSLKSSADLPIAMDPWGDPVIPVTGVVGALRAHATSVLGEAVRDLFGSESALDRRNEPDELVPSPVRFLGTKVTAPRVAEVLQLRQTAVSRWSGAASGRSLRTREALPAGVKVVIYAIAEDLPDAASEDLRRVLSSWAPRLGGAQSTGSGSLEVSSIKAVVLDLEQQSDLSVWLSLGDATSFDALDYQEWPHKQQPTAGCLSLRWEFRLVGDLRIGDKKQSQGSEITSLRYGDTYVIPGSSWKGVFRSRAEFIVRSCGFVACKSTDDHACGLPECVTCEAFGHSGNRGEAETGGPTGAQAKVRFATSQVGKEQQAVRTHVSIDRFTGGARRGQLHTETVLTHGRAVLAIDVPSDIAPWCVPLFAWVAKDIHDGYVGIGHGTSRGMGSLALAKPDHVAKLAESLIPLLEQRRSAASDQANPTAPGALQ